MQQEVLDKVQLKNTLCCSPEPASPSKFMDLMLSPMWRLISEAENREPDNQLSAPRLCYSVDDSDRHLPTPLGPRVRDTSRQRDRQDCNQGGDTGYKCIGHRC